MVAAGLCCTACSLLETVVTSTGVDVLVCKAPFLSYLLKTDAYTLKATDTPNVTPREKPDRARTQP